MHFFFVHPLGKSRKIFCLNVWGIYEWSNLYSVGSAIIHNIMIVLHMLQPLRAGCALSFYIYSLFDPSSLTYQHSPSELFLAKDAGFLIVTDSANMDWVWWVRPAYMMQLTAFYLFSLPPCIIKKEELIQKSLLNE